MLMIDMHGVVGKTEVTFARAVINPTLETRSFFTCRRSSSCRCSSPCIQCRLTQHTTQNPAVLLLVNLESVPATIGPLRMRKFEPLIA